MAFRVAVAVCVGLLGVPFVAAGAEVAAPASPALPSAADAKAWLTQANAILAKTGADRDVGAAVALLTRAAAAGNTGAMRVLATLLVKGDGVPADPDRAEALLKQAVAAGDVKGGSEALGDFYRSGTPPRDPVKAIDAYQQAAAAGNTSAMRKVAALIAKGDGATADPTQAEALLQKAIAAGDKGGYESLGDFYALTTPLADPVREADAYQSAADAGNTSAMRKLAALLSKGGAGLPPDPPRAEALLVKAVAAGDTKWGNEALGDLYRSDTPLKDLGKAAAAYQLAADTGETGAMRKLAAVYLAGGDGIAADPAHAEALFEKAIAAGDKKGGYESLGDFYALATPLADPVKEAGAYQSAADAGSTSAMRKLAALLGKGGAGLPADPDRAEALLKQAVAAGDVKGGEEALGDFYRSGTPPRDPVKAIDAYQQAAAAGDTSAMRKVAALIAKGDGTTADPTQAEALLQKAIAAGDKTGGYESLGDFYALATPLADAAKEADAYQSAADAGNTSAMRKLAALLGKGGAGLPADPDRAEALLKQAVAAGDAKWGNEALGDLYHAETPLKDLGKAAAAYQLAADAGETGAMRKLAALYLAGGDGISADPAHAETLLEQAASAGDRYGWDALGDLYRAPTPLMDATKAADAYQHAADAGSTGSARKLMTMLANGDGIAADPARALAIAQQVIAGGDAKTGYEMLGDFYRVFTPLQSGVKAADAYQQAANAGNTSAMRKLASILGRGDGVAADGPRAVALLTQDIAAGDVKGGNEALGDFYRTETALKDLGKATAAYQAAADAGDTSAMRKLASMLTVKSPGLQPDPKRAETLIQQAIAAGDSAYGFGALGDFYLSKTPLNNPAKAIDAYQQATAAGNQGALIKLANAHLNGALGKSGSPAKGIDLLKQAIAGNVPGAAVALANAYIGNKNVTPSPAAAVKILDTAASTGDVAAARRLINLYSVGNTHGIARSLDKAGSVLAAITPLLTPDIRALEELVLDAARATSAAARSAVLARYEAFQGDAKATAATRIYQVSPETYVFIAQAQLAQRGLYKGAPTGKFSTATARAMMRFCGQADLGTACSHGPLSYSAIVAMAKTL